VTNPSTNGRFVLPILLVLALSVRLAVAASVPPASDVYYYLTQAVQALLGGMNPYDHAYVGIPPLLVTPGAGHVLAYLPFTVLYLVPFYIAATCGLASWLRTS
jgi:hypothetical protein